MKRKELRLEQKEIYYPFPNGKGYLYLYRLYWDNTEEVFCYHFGEWFKGNEAREDFIIWIDAKQESPVNRSQSRITVAYQKEERAILAWQWDTKKGVDTKPIAVTFPPAQ